MNASNSIGPLILGKHLRDWGKDLDDQREAKKQKVKGTENNVEFTFTSIHADCILNILRFLSIKELLTFERVEKGLSIGFFTCHRWQEICIDKRFNFDCSDLDKYPENLKDKMCYLAGRTLITYSKTSFSDTGRPPYLDQFPLLKAYVGRKITENDELLCLSKEKSKAGNQLLVGLYYLRQYFDLVTDETLEKAKTFLTHAIQKGATVASLLAVRLVRAQFNLNRVNVDFYTFLFDIAELSITENGAKDYRGLHQCLLELATNERPFCPKFTEFVEQYVQRKSNLPPVLEYRAIECYREHQDWVKAEDLFNQAVTQYGDHILPQTWENLYHFKYFWAKKKQKITEALDQEIDDKDLQDVLFYKRKLIVAWKGDEEAIYSFLTTPIIQNNQMIGSSSLFSGIPKKDQEIKKWVEELLTHFPNKKEQIRKLLKREIASLGYVGGWKYLWCLLCTYEEKETPINLLWLSVWRYIAEKGIEKTTTFFNNALAISQNRGEAWTCESFFTAAKIGERLLLNSSDDVEITDQAKKTLEEAEIHLKQGKSMLEADKRELFFDCFPRSWLKEMIKELEEDLKERKQDLESADKKTESFYESSDDEIFL